MMFIFDLIYNTTLNFSKQFCFVALINVARLNTLLGCRITR